MRQAEPCCDLGNIAYIAYIPVPAENIFRPWPGSRLDHRGKTFSQSEIEIWIHFPDDSFRSLLATENAVRRHPSRARSLSFLLCILPLGRWPTKRRCLSQRAPTRRRQAGGSFAPCVRTKTVCARRCDAFSGLVYVWSRARFLVGGLCAVYPKLSVCCSRMGSIWTAVKALGHEAPLVWSMARPGDGKRVHATPWDRQCGAPSILQADVLGRGICGIKRAASNVCTESAKLIDLSPLFRGIATAAVWTVRIARGCACASIWPSQRAHVREGGKEGGKSPPRKAGDLLFAILKKS